MDIENFWIDAPDSTYKVEPTWDEFITSISGIRVSDELSKSPSFNNADYYLPKEQVVIELKEIVTEFSHSKSFQRKFNDLISSKEAMSEEKFLISLLRIFRPPLSRILKKANKQIRETKDHYSLRNNRGIAVIVNDGFVSLEPEFIMAIISDLLVNSYSSIDCMIYVTLNRYIDFKDSDVPKLLWAPQYSTRVESGFDLHNFVNKLGEKWFSFLDDNKIKFTVDREEDDRPLQQALRGATSIIIPGEFDGSK